MRTITAEARPVAQPTAGSGRLLLVMIMVGVVTLATLGGLVLIKTTAGTTGEAEPVPVAAEVAAALTEAATSCSALSPGRLAGQVMATTGFAATPEGGIAGLTAGQWETWKPSAEAVPNDAAASVTALAHLTCDMVGKVRATGMRGDLWRLAVAALRSSLTELGAARGVPASVADHVVKVESYAAWYNGHLTLPNPTPTGPLPSVTASATSEYTTPSVTASATSEYTTPAGPTAVPTTTALPFALSFPTFRTATGLRLNGAAQVAGGQLNLTTGQEQAGSAWARTTIDTKRSFTSAFTALISEPTDGLAFVVQAEGPTALGAGGAGLGYGALPGADPADGIRPSVAVELDPWDNSADGWDPAGHQHIAVTTNGDVTRHLAWQDPGFDIAANQPVSVWLDYDAVAHRLLVYAAPGPAARPSTPLLAYPIDLRALLGTGRAYIGFTGGTGYTNLTNSRESVLSWSVSSV